MFDGFDAKAIQDFAKEIVQELTEAAAIARVADGYGEPGFYRPCI